MSFTVHATKRWPFVLVALVTLASNTSGEPLPAKTAARLTTRVVEELVHQGIPAISAAVADGSGVTWSIGAGHSDIENALRAKPSTVYRLASVSKSYTATAVMQLAEGGKLDLDAPIQTYCPAFPAKPRPVTARDLLGHLAGVRHYRDDEATNTRRFTSVIDALVLFAADPLENMPGEKFLYTTYGYNVLGCAVEGVSGTPFMRYLQENVFARAGTTHTRDDDARAIIPGRAQGYQRDPSGAIVNSALADTSSKIPGGGLCSTADDVARFGAALLHGRLVSQATRETMFTEGKTRAGIATGYGLGWIVRPGAGPRTVWHTGGQERVSTVLLLRPEEGLAIALLSNLEEAKLLPLAREIASTLGGTR